MPTRSTTLTANEPLPLYGPGEHPHYDAAALPERQALLRDLIDAQSAYRKLRFCPVPTVKADALDLAFRATANVGVFNREHPAMRIEPLADPDQP